MSQQTEFYGITLILGDSRVSDRPAKLHLAWSDIHIQMRELNLEMIAHQVQEFLTGLTWPQTEFSEMWWQLQITQHYKKKNKKTWFHVVFLLCAMCYSIPDCSTNLKDLWNTTNPTSRKKKK